MRSDRTRDALFGLDMIPGIVERENGVDFSEFERILPRELMRTANRVILTGEETGYGAALAAADVFERIEDQKADRFAIRTETADAMSFSRYYDSYRKFWLEDKNAGLNRVNPLICCVGGFSRASGLAEAEKKAAAYQSVPVTFSARAQESGQAACRYTIRTPDGGDANAYYTAASSALCRFALYFHAACGRMTDEQAAAQWRAARAYAGAFTPVVMEKTRKKARAMAAAWREKGVRSIDFMADGPDFAAAQQGAQAVLTRANIDARVFDSEAWTQARARFADPSAGLVAVINDASPAFSEGKEAVRRAAAAGMPTAVITDARDGAFPEETTVFRLPRVEKRWCARLLEHLPIAYFSVFTADEPAASL